MNHHSNVNVWQTISEIKFVLAGKMENELKEIFQMICNQFYTDFIKCSFSSKIDNWRSHRKCHMQMLHSQLV